MSGKLRHRTAQYCKGHAKNDPCLSVPKAPVLPCYSWLKSSIIINSPYSVPPLQSIYLAAVRLR